jgi:nucleotide sugar dehydrogenase
MKPNFDIYLVNTEHTIKEVLSIFQKIGQIGLPTGIAVLVDADKKVTGAITEGDIRRAIISGYQLDDKIKGIGSSDPICFNEYTPYKEIVERLPAILEKKGRFKKFFGKIILTNNEGQFTRVIGYHELWEQRVATHRHVVVLGMGYVGLTLALVMAEEGFYITGVDTDSRKINQLAAGKSYVFEKGLPELLTKELGKNFHPTTTIPEDGDVYIISVGTPVKKLNGENNPKPILDYIKMVSESVGKKLQPGNLVVLRSTVPVGTSRDIVLPLLEKHSGLRCGVDFHLTFAPERTAEGKALQELRELPQIIGGFNEESVEATAAMFRELTSTIVRVSSLEAAEIVKLVNNTFRDLVFAYANQVAQIASHFNVDIFEVIKSANQGYPRNPVPLPSPGVGGPCLTKDPYIFADVVEKIFDSRNTLFEQGRHVNEYMHHHVGERVIAQLKKLGKPLEQTKVLVCGLAFKGRPQTGDVRNSSSVEIYHILKERIPNVIGHDPVALREDIISENVEPIEDIEAAFKNADVVLFLNNNPFYDKLNMRNLVLSMQENPIIFDGWHMFRYEDLLQIRPSIYMGLSLVKSSIK